MQSLFLNSAENDDNADSFAERAENYYRKRPQLLAFLSDLYHRYLSLADRYCLLKQQSQISTVQLDDEDDYDRQINNYPNPDSDAESTLSYQPPHAENLGDETLPRRKKQPEFDATGIRLVGKTADEIIETYTRKNLRDVNMRQLAELAGNNSREPAYGNDGSGKLVPETQSRCQEIRSGRDLQDGLVEKSAVQRCEASSGNQSYRNIRRVVEETTVDTEGTLSPRKIGQESEIIVRQRVENNCRETDVEQKLPGSKKRAENHPEIPSESDFRTRLAGAVSGTDQNSCWKLTVVKNQNQSRKIRPESDAKYRHVAKPGRKRCWEVVVSGQKRRETMPETERLVGEIVAKTVDCEVLVNEVGVLQQCQTELFRKIDLQRSLLEVLESERLILLSENGRLGFRITAMAEENKGLVSEIVFLKRKANEMARWVVKMREEERVCMVSRKIENLQGQICRLEKNNREYYEKLVRREEKGEGRSPMDRVKAENVRLQDLMRVNKGRDGVGRFLDRVKVLLCGFVDSAR